jgi:hypothetical protein
MQIRVLKGGAQSACLHNKEPAPKNVSCAALGISISDAARRIRVLNSTPSLYRWRVYWKFLSLHNPVLSLQRRCRLFIANYHSLESLSVIYVICI